MKKIIAVLTALSLAFTVFGVVSFAAEPKISVSQSLGDGYTYVKISGTGSLYYTTDGTKPTQSSKKYTKKIKITEPCKLRVASYSGGKRLKAVYKTISVRVKAPVVSLASNNGTKAVYSVSAPSGAAVYATTDGTTPTKTNGFAVYNTVTLTENCTLKLVSVMSGRKSSKVKTVEVTGILSAQDYASEVLRLVNAERTSRGLSALQSDSNLSKAAQVRAKELTSSYSHSRPDGSDCFTVFDECGVNGYWRAGENIAAGYRTPAEVVNGWMNSDGHRRNILNPDFTHLGVGYATASDYYGTYWSELFIG